ncbi:MAG: hypothetical protein ABH844_05910 [Candidatus Omnitrophota bacterium]
MRKVLFCLVVVCGMAMSTVSFAQDVEKTQAQKEKDVLVSNIIALRNKEARVAVLQQLLSEEFNSLSQMQAVFCDRYKLTPDKFRAGEYVYNEEEGKLVEKPMVEEKTD